MVKIVGKLTKKGGEVLVGWEGSTYMPGDSDGQQRDGGWGVWECGRVGVGMGNKGEGGWVGREAARVKGARPRKQGAVGQIKSRAN